ESRRPSIGVIGWVIAGIALAQNDSDQVVWTGGVVAILHFGSDFVVGLGGDLGKRNSRRVIAKRSESFNLGHLGALELYQVDGDYPGSKGRPMRGVDKLLHKPRIQAQSREPRRVGDKVLTLLVQTCDTILTRFEDYMARLGRGSSRPRVLIRQFLIQKPSQVCVYTFLSILLTTLFLFLIVPSVLAQSPDIDDVHISPRIDT